MLPGTKLASAAYLALCSLQADQGEGAAAQAGKMHLHLLLSGPQVLVP